MRCFYCECISEENSVIKLSERENLHLFRTLRASPGSEVKLIDGKGIVALGKVGTQKGYVTVVSKTAYPEPVKKLHLFLSPPKRQQMDQILKQCVELGVWSINLMMTEYSVSVPNHKSIDKRWHQLLIEACKQSRNPYKPILGIPLSLDNAIKQIRHNKFTALFGHQGSEQTMKNKFETLVGNAENIAWIVGPEGGFSNSEINRFDDNGFLGLKLGQWTMRSETAVVAGCSILSFTDMNL